MAEPAQCQISGPERLAVRQASRRGPFAGRGALMRLRPVRFTSVNPGTAPCAIVSFGIDPLQRAGVGATIEAPLSLRPVGREGDASLPPAGYLIFELRGEVPAQPGSYTTTARIQTEGGGSLAIPVSIEIPASPLWGVGCMVLGLFCLGLSA